MNVDYVLFLSKETLVTAIMVLAPLLGAGLVVGLSVGIFQAVTQIHEMTLTFIPKMAVVGLVLLVLVPWFLEILLGNMRQCLGVNAVVREQLRVLVQPQLLQPAVDIVHGWPCSSGMR